MKAHWKLLLGLTFVGSAHGIATAQCGPECSTATGGVADTDGDCDVDLSDLANTLANFGVPAGATLADGDTDGDGDVDLTDLANVLSRFGVVCPGTAPQLRITGFQPNVIRSGERVSIFGHGFGNDPDDLCIATTGGAFLQAEFATPELVVARVVDLPNLVQPGFLMMARGDGSSNTLEPRPGIAFEEEAWVWLGTDDLNDKDLAVNQGVIDIDPDEDFLPDQDPNNQQEPNEPFDPNVCTQYFDFDGNGDLTMTLEGNWANGDRFSIFLRAYCLDPFVRAPDVHIPCIRIDNPDPSPADCAAAICDAITQAYDAAGITIDCTVLPGPEIVISYPDCEIDGPNWGLGGANPSYLRCK